jgi:hypothetical protein
MDRILEAAQNDFEEGGYAPGTLGDLKEVSDLLCDYLPTPSFPRDLDEILRPSSS